MASLVLFVCAGQMALLSQEQGVVILLQLSLSHWRLFLLMNAVQQNYSMSSAKRCLLHFTGVS